MSSLVIEGGQRLQGEIAVSGAKNLALKAIAASLLSRQPIRLERVPEIEDVKRQLEILGKLGANIVRHSSSSYTIDTRAVESGVLAADLVPKLRASAVLIGPLLARGSEVLLPHPGGCKIGRRPIDLFIRGFQALGVQVKANQDNSYHFSTKGLRGGRFVFPQVSVTATETMMLAATLARGKTELINAAIEPEIPVLADYLNSCGARIEGAGTPRVTIEGVKEIGASTLTMIPDRIEAGTFAIMAAATGDHLKITGCNPYHLEVPLEVLKQVGVQVKVTDDTIEIESTRSLRPVNITTHEYPGFVTDFQPPMTVLLTQANGHSLVHETIFEGRLFFTDTLNQMGADITLCDPHRVLIHGPTPLAGRTVETPDARAGLALLIAALIAPGKSQINNIYQIDRGYERLEQRLQAIGAKIKRQ